MILGHISLAFGARWRTPGMPLPWLLTATFAPDLIRAILQASGMAWGLAIVYSHALPWAAAWACAFAALTWSVTRRAHGSILIFSLVLSHIALDMVFGRKPLWVGGPIGMNLERIQQLEFALEAIAVTIAWSFLRRTTVAPWLKTPQFIGALFLILALYLRESFKGRPQSTRCWTYPFSPCWSRL